MSNLVKFWNTVVKAVGENVEDLREVRAYAGEFEAKEKGRISIRTPGALVAVTGNDVATKLPDGRLSLHVAVAVAVICEDRRKAVDTIAATIAEKIVGLMRNARPNFSPMARMASCPLRSAPSCIAGTAA